MVRRIMICKILCCTRLRYCWYGVLDWYYVKGL